jgi:thymidine kinase
MFAGKTTELLRRIDRAKLAHRRCIVMKYNHDIRYSDTSIATHDLQTHTAIPCARLLPHLSLCLECDLIAVDEGQFFPDLVEFADTLTDQGKTVVIAGLDGDFRRKPFGRILDLIPKSETIQKLSAVCTVTGSEACFTQRMTDSQELEVIGGAETYRAASRSAFTGRSTKGEIHVTVGPVRSGKTTELKRLLTRHQIAGRKPVMIRSPKGGQIEGVGFGLLTTEKLPGLEEIGEFDTIGIDEAQRFEGLAEWADAMASAGKLVEVSALDGNYEREPFRNVIEVVSVSEQLKKLDSICPITGMLAPFSAMYNGASIPISRLALMQARMSEKAVFVA